MKCHKTYFITQFSTEVYMLELISQFRSAGDMSTHRRCSEKVMYINKPKLETCFFVEIGEQVHTRTIIHVALLILYHYAH